MEWHAEKDVGTSKHAEQLLVGRLPNRKKLSQLMLMQASEAETHQRLRHLHWLASPHLEASAPFRAAAAPRSRQWRQLMPAAWPRA